jgi:hypothetical protein
MKRIKQYKIAERAAYGFKKNGTEEKKLKQLIRRTKKKDADIENEHIEDPERLLEVLTNEIRENRMFYKKGSKYEYSLQPKIKEFLTKHYIPYIHREYMELINTLLKKQGEKVYTEHVRRK